MTRKYDTSRKTTKPGVEIPKRDWYLMKKIAKKRGLEAWFALNQAISEWNERNKGIL